MRTLHVSTSMDPKAGGISQGILALVLALKAQGIDCEVVSLEDPQAACLQSDILNLHKLGPAKGPWAYSSRLLPWLKANLKNYDVILINGLWLYHSQAVIKAMLSLALDKRPKLLVMPHGMLDPYFQHATGRWLKAIRNWLYWKLFEEQVINAADGILFTTQEELELARTTFRPYHPRNELNIGYGISAPPAFNKQMQEAFAEKKPGLSNKSYFLFLGRIHEKKGVDLLIQAYLNLSQGQELPDLVIAGPGWKEEYGQRISKLAKKNPHIHFLGMLEGDAKWGAFYGCEAFVLPSHQENFGIAVVEALACSKPVLISNKVNIWREVEAHGAGIIANDNEQGVVEQLKKWLKMHEEEKRKMGERAFISYEKSFSVGEAAKKMKKILEEL